MGRAACCDQCTEVRVHRLYCADVDNILGRRCSWRCFILIIHLLCKISVSLSVDVSTTTAHTQRSNHHANIRWLYRHAYDMPA